MLANKHRVAEAVEAVALLNGFGVGHQDEVAACQSAGEHEQG